MADGARRREFRADIEGLRAVAVVGVVLFHAEVPGMAGGFVGVDVFFVISGFLITGLLWREVQSTGTVRAGRFYGARARRLLPAGILVLIVTAVASAALLSPLQARSVLGDAVASALYVGNYRFAVQGTDYLAADVPPSPFQHYWWPVLLLAPLAVGQPLGWEARLAAAAVAAGLAVVTLVAVENPVRFWAPLRTSGGRSLLLGGAVTAVGVSASLVALLVVPAPVGHGVAAAAPRIGAPAASSPPASSPAAPTEHPARAALRALTDLVQAAVAAPANLRAVPANLTPPLADAFAQKPEVFVNGCVRSWLYVGQDECASAAVASATTVALVGDSHAAMWFPALDRIAAQRQWRLETMGKVTCPMFDLPITSPYLGRAYTECTQWRAQILDRLRAERPALVVVSMSRRYGLDYGFTVYRAEWLDTSLVWWPSSGPPVPASWCSAGARPAHLRADLPVRPPGLGGGLHPRSRHRGQRFRCRRGGARDAGRRSPLREPDRPLLYRQPLPGDRGKPARVPRRQPSDRGPRRLARPRPGHTHHPGDGHG